VALPGGFGTLDEMFEALTLKQTGKIHDFPVVLFGTKFWSGLVHWIKGRLLAEKMISPHDLDLFVVTDDVDEVVRVIERHHLDRVRQRGEEASGRETP
jgi:hypothetical protein